MNKPLLCVATFLTLTGCGFADLEFYPDYRRHDVSGDDWLQDRPEVRSYAEEEEEEEKLPLYREDDSRQYPYGDYNTDKQLDRGWPRPISKTLLKNQDLARRLTKINRKFEESGKIPHYYFKTQGLTKEQEERIDKIYQTLESRAAEFIPRFRPNFHILDDVRLHSETPSTEYSLPNNNEASIKVSDGKDERNVEGLKHEDKSAETVDDPDEFAYTPFNPHYFDDLPKPVVVDVKNKADDGIQTQNLRDTVDPEFPIEEKEQERQTDDTLAVVPLNHHLGDDTTGVYIIAIVAGISAAATVGLIAFGIGWYNLQKHVKNASDVEYPAYGVTGPNKDISPSGDRRLAQSAQMYHYQHQKQQIIAMESRAAANERRGSVSEPDSEEDNEEGDYTVYECPGLAPTGEMEVKNPMFHDDPTPAQTPALKAPEEEKNKK